MAAVVFTTFAEVQTALQNFVTNNKIPIARFPTRSHVGKSVDGYGGATI